MDWATPTDYRHAIQDPPTALADEELRGGQVARNARGLPHALVGQLRQRLPHPLSGHGQDLGAEVLHPRSARPAGALSPDRRLPGGGPLALHRAVRLSGAGHPGPRASGFRR